MAKLYKILNMQCSRDTFKEVFGEITFDTDYFSGKKTVEVNLFGKKFEYLITSYGYELEEPPYFLQPHTISSPNEVNVTGMIRKAPTEKEVLEEKIQRLKVELKQAKNKLEGMEDD